MARKLDDKKMLTIGTQKSDRVTEIVNSCFGKSVLEVEKYFA